MIHIFYVCFISGFLYNFCAFSSILTAMQFALRQGVMSGFIAGMGHTAAQIIWIAIAIGAISMGSDILQNEINHYKFIAALLLFFLGVRLLVSSPVSTQRIHKYTFSGHISGFLTVFAVAISAPGRIIGYSALLLLMGVPPASANAASKIFILVSTLTGVVVWWLLFSLMIRGFRIRFTPTQAIWLQRMTALLLMAIAVIFMLTPSINVL